MFRKTLPAAAAIALAVALVGGALAYDVPDRVLLERPKNNQKLNSWVDTVDFPHGYHAIRVPCRGCHHKETDKTLGKFVGCRQCHSSDDPNDANGFYRAWHSDGPPSCLGCHAKMRTEGGKNPVGCTTACHKPG